MLPKCEFCGSEPSEIRTLDNGKKLYKCKNNHFFPEKNLPEEIAKEQRRIIEAQERQKKKKFKFSPYSDISFEELVKIVHLMGLTFTEDHEIFHSDEYKQLRRHFQTEVK